MTLKAVIGAILIYHFNLDWWWWLILGIAFILDISTDIANNQNSANTVDRLNEIKYEIQKER